MIEDGVLWRNTLHDETPLQTFLVSKFRNLGTYDESIREFYIQQKALTKDANYLSILRTRLEETLGVLQILAVDGCSLNTKHHHEQTRDVLQERITFFEHVILQRENAILYGKDTLEKIQGFKKGVKEE
jgi:hypothetical protein